MKTFTINVTAMRRRYCCILPTIAIFWERGVSFQFFFFLWFVDVVFINTTKKTPIRKVESKDA